MVEGESPYSLAPGARPEDESECSSEDDELGADAGASLSARGLVYRLSRGQLRKLEGGMEQYEELCSRAAAKLGKHQ